MTLRNPLIALATATLMLCMVNANAAARGADLSDPLVSVDRNRTHIIADVVKGSGLEGDAADKLRARLGKLRADRLMAASLATSQTSLEAVLTHAESTATTAVATGAQSKSLGDPRADLVYTPLNPCRLIDTRGFGAPFTGGVFQPNERRSYSPESRCLIPFAKVVSLMVTFTTENLTPNSGGFISIVGPASPITTSSDIFNLASTWSQSTTIVNSGDGGQFDIYVTGATANVVVDVLGFFGPPVGGSPGTGTVTSITGGPGITGGTITGAGTLSIATPYQLPQSCGNGQVPTSNGAGVWTCVTPSGGTAATTIVAETAFGQAAAVGASGAYARADHTHGTPALPAMGGDVSGTMTAASVTRVRGVDVAAVAPTPGQVLTFTGSQAVWSPPASAAAVLAFGGAAGNVGASNPNNVFVGSTAPVHINGATTRVTGAATATLRTSNGTAVISYGICYQPQAGGTITNPAITPTSANVTTDLTALTATFSFANVNAGDYNVGFCAINNTVVAIDGTQKSVNGWAVVAN